MEQTGRFIAFDGLDGSGKGTQIALYAEHCRRRGETVLITPSLSREGYAGEIRRAMIGDIGAQMHPLPRQLFVAAAYLTTYYEVIAPALARGETVILDRSVPISTLTYGAADDVNIATLANLAGIIALNTRPADICYVLDVPYNVASARIGARTGQELSHFDAPSMQKFEARRKWLREFTRRYNWAQRINGNGTPDEVSARILAHESK